ncbi:hypothetical protein JCM9534A_18520 [Catenuloplanes indicus JCM 9534]
MMLLIRVLWAAAADSSNRGGILVAAKYCVNAAGTAPDLMAIVINDSVTTGSDIGSNGPVVARPGLGRRRIVSAAPSGRLAMTRSTEPKRESPSPA